METNIEQDASPQWFQGVIDKWEREPDYERGGEWVTLYFERGGKVMVYTRSPLMWVEPERH